MYVSKAKQETLATMVLAHRVAVRRAARLEVGSDEWFTASSQEQVTQYALELVLEPVEQHKVDYIRTTLDTAARASDLYMDACVAQLRLEQFGIEV